MERDGRGMVFSHDRGCLLIDEANRIGRWLVSYSTRGQKHKVLGGTALYHISGLWPLVYLPYLSLK